MNIQAIIAAPVSQAKAVDRLVAHCRRLDGTEVKVIPISKAHDDAYMKRYPDCDFACLQASGLRYCAEKMAGQPFFWLEHDSIPLKPGWLKTLTKEYERQKKPFLISSDSNPPNDLVGGIGFYSGDTRFLVPDFFPTHGWDLWMLKHIPDLIGRTPLIQHSYGNYNHQGLASEHFFPQESWIIRKDALVFHRDKHQGLITGKPVENVFLHSGDLGDIVAALPVIRHLGGGEIVFTDSKGIRPMCNRMHLIEPLLKAAPYVRECKFQANPNKPTHDFTTFRKVYDRNRTLSESQAEWVGAKGVQYHPWLDVNPAKETKGRIVCCRSPRYRNQSFPWKQITKAHRDRIVFIGLDDEYSDFQQMAGATIDRLKAKNLLEIAQYIAGSDLFIGNQSSPCWISMALGHTMIQETHETIRDSIVQRQNAQFVSDGVIK